MADWRNRLTEAQREALRLVAQNFESKEIGRRLGVTHHAINRRIERAVTLMGARSRKDAARLLMVEEGRTYDRSTYDPIHLDPATDSVMVGAPEDPMAEAYPWPWVSPRNSRRLTRRERLFWALVGLPLVIMLIWGVFLSGIGALDVLRL